MDLKLEIKRMLKNIEYKINNSEIFEKEESEEDSNKWKNEDRFNDFIYFLTDLVKEQGVIKSNMFDEHEEKLDSYTIEEFHILLESFERAISVYASENFIEDKYDMDEDLYLEESSIVVKIDEKFYKVESFVGNDAHISFTKIYDFKPNRNNYVDYNLMIRNRKNPRYEETVKELIHEDLDDIKDKIIASNVSKEVFTEALEEYLRNEKIKDNII